MPRPAWPTCRASTDGPVSSVLNVTDGAGNTASANGAAITLDTTAPSAPGLSLATDSGSSDSDQITNIGTVNVSGLRVGGNLAVQH